MLLSSHRHKAFTLIEIIVVIVVMGILAVVGTEYLQQGLTSYVAQQNITLANWEGRGALEQMVRVITMIRSQNDITTAGASTLTFVDQLGNTDTYTLSGTNLQYNSQTLATGVSSLTFTYLNDSWAVTATLTAIRYIVVSITVTQSNANYTLRTTIAPRNLFPY